MPHLTPAPNYIGTPTGNTARELNRCIEVVLKELEAELAESANSSVNLADKLRGTLPQQTGQNTPLAPGAADVFGRLEQILNTVRTVNQQLGHAHNAISG